MLSKDFRFTNQPADAPIISSVLSGHSWQERFTLHVENCGDCGPDRRGCPWFCAAGNVLFRQALLERMEEVKSFVSVERHSPLDRYILYRDPEPLPLHIYWTCGRVPTCEHWFRFMAWIHGKILRVFG